MFDNPIQHLSDEEIIAKVHEEQEAAAALGRERFGDLADAIDILRYRLYEWWERRSTIRPIHDMTHLYRETPSLARELAVLSCARSGLTNMMHAAMLLRSGAISSIPAIYRVTHELFIDATFLRLDTSGRSAVRMLDWQLADTARIASGELGLQSDHARMKEEYRDDENFGTPGAWAELPNGKNYHKFNARMQYVYAKMEKEVPDNVLGNGDWERLKQATINQRARANATMHASPIASTRVDSQIFMAAYAAQYASQTVAVYQRVSDEWLDENVDDVLAELGEVPLLQDESAWVRSIIAVEQLRTAMEQTVASWNTEHHKTAG